MRILLLKEEWGKKILSGGKTWELRGSPTKVRERIAIAFSKTSCKFGEVTLADCIPLTKELYENNAGKHCFPAPWEELLKTYKQPYAWVLKDAKPYEEPVPYVHPHGAVVWVLEAE